MFDYSTLGFLVFIIILNVLYYFCAHCLDKPTRHEIRKVSHMDRYKAWGFRITDRLILATNELVFKYVSKLNYLLGIYQM